jgi:pimeloyl-ACP methyl ester carboxylesterase
MGEVESGRTATVTRRNLILGATAVGVAACAPSGHGPVNQPNNSSGGVIQMAKPTIVLVHGFWGGAAHWSKVIVQLSNMVYDSVHAVENPLSSLADDAERTRKMIAQQRGPVVLVGHSYGGMVITEAGNQPNVVALVYIAAFAPDTGESIVDLSKGYPAPGGASVAPDSDGYLWIDQKKYHESFCQDLTSEEALVMAVTQKAPLGSTTGDKVKAPAWKAKPSWYQVSSEDRMISPENEKRMSSRIGAKKVITLPSSHASLASRPLEVSALIDEAAKATSTT